MINPLIYIGITIVPICFYLFYKIGLKIGIGRGEDIGAEKFKRLIKKGTGRYGIIKFVNGYGGTRYIIEIEEIEVAGDLTKVNVIGVSTNYGDKDSQEKILSKFNEWVDTRKIVWYDNNSQRIRDEKLEQILK